jgi:hypothetical protein
MPPPELKLTEPADDSRFPELCLKHTIGRELFREIREYALGQIDSELPIEAKAAATKAVNDVVYGLLKVLDGDAGGLEGETSRVTFRVLAELTKKTSGEVVHSLNLFEGDGTGVAVYGIPSMA